MHRNWVQEKLVAIKEHELNTCSLVFHWNVLKSIKLQFHLHSPRRRDSYWITPPQGVESWGIYFLCWTISTHWEEKIKWNVNCNHNSEPHGWNMQKVVVSKYSHKHWIVGEATFDYTRELLSRSRRTGRYWQWLLFHRTLCVADINNTI